MTQKIKVSDFEISNSKKLTVIAGLNVLENDELTFKVANELKAIVESKGNPFIFKASFDKANRSSVDSYRGPGLDEGLRTFSELRRLGHTLITDVHEINQVKKIADVVDIIQIPAFLCRQTDLIKEACETGKPINVKKGQFLSPNQMENIISKCDSFGNNQILLCERGTSFGYDNLVVDMLGISKLKTFKSPVIFDVTHSLQLPGQGQTSAGGRAEQAVDLAKAGVALGIAGIFIEVHPDPKNALCDGPSATSLDKFENLLDEVNKVDNAVKDFIK
jgi:2-dehydro-3-deoxyphosphooctonate aldolase (KDO 8-P synthase)